MSKSVTATWSLPTAREEGGDLPVGEIANVEVELSADAVNFGSLVTVSAGDVQTLFIPDLEDGDYVFRFTTVDTEGRRSNPPLTTPFSVLDDSAPLNVSGVNITFE